MKYIILLVALVASTTHAVIFDTATGTNTGITRSCTFNTGEAMRAYLQNVSDTNHQARVDSETATTRWQGVTFEFYNETFSGASNCFGQYAAHTRMETLNTNNGQWYAGGIVDAGATSNGIAIDAPTCPPEGQAFFDYSIFGVMTDGTPQCYTVQSLKDVATCDLNGELLPPTQANTPFACKTKDDGSKCLYEQGQQGSQTFYEPSAEPSTCFDGGYDEYEVDTGLTQPTGNDCVDIGNGVVACPENELNVCSSSGGVQSCQTGCGSVTFGGTTGFYCFDDDTDGDGIGNYADPDIDGDGIHNDDDLDADGDGQDDPDYGNNGSGSEGQGTGDGSGSGSGDINVELDFSEIIEQGDFEGTSSLNNADSKLATEQSAIDTILDSDTIDFANTIEETGVDDSFDTLKSVLTPSACSASFAIPFTTNELDMCESANKAKPFLYVLFAIGTFIYIYRRIMGAVGSEK